MKLPVLVEAVSNGGFVAKLGSPFELTAIGQSREEARVNLQHAVKLRYASDECVYVHVPDHVHPLLKWVGTLPDDEMTQEWRREIEAYRRRKDVEDEINGVDW